MFINKINNNFYPQKTNFKGYSHELDSVGTRVLRFNYPFDYETKRCFVEFFKVAKDDSAYAGYKVIENNNPPKIEIQQGGTEVELNSLMGLKDNEALAYRVVVTDKDGNNRWERVEAGTHIYNGKYVLVTRDGLMPMNKGGKGVLTMPDSHLPGAYYAPFSSQKPGEIKYDENRQKQAEQTIRTYNNRFGGSLAGVHHDLKRLHDEGIKVLGLTPFASGATSDYHGYWNENNNQMCEAMGNIENFDALVRDSFKYGMRIMFDYTFTSEGLNGIHYQYALRWGEKDPYAKYLFTTEPSVTFGIVPNNQENLRHKVENSPVVYEQDSNGIIKIKENRKYDSSKETYFIPTEVSNKLDKLESNSYQDSVISYRLQLIDPKAYETRLRALSEYNKTAKKPIMVDSPEGTIFLATNGSWNIQKDAAGAVMWDANVDMVKRNHGLSGYDETILQAEPSLTRREVIRENRRKGAVMNTDMDMQTIHRWAGRVKDQETLYIAQNLKGAKTAEDIDALIKKGLLPEEAKLSPEKVENIINEWYQLSPTGILSKDDVTLRAIMKLPLDALEVAPITAGVLSSPFFTNRAINSKTIGKSKFELMKMNNPQLEQPYVNIYTKMEKVYVNELKDFTHSVIEAINKNSTEKLLDKNGNYTEFGENIVSILGQDIVKYALLKAISGNAFETKIDEETGVINYNYPKLRENTGLLALDINANTPEEEASKLFDKIQKGLKSLNRSDIEMLSTAFGTQIKGMVTTDLRLAKAIYTEASLGLDGRLDAVKDNIDMDAVRNRYNTFDDAWQNLINYCRNLVDAYLEENPGAVITAEITDITSLLQKTFGNEIDFSNPGACFEFLEKYGSKYKSESDAILHLIQESGITTEAGYSYFFTSVIEALSRNFENGNSTGNIHSIMHSLNTLITTRNLDYIKNLFTFVGNHDKARVVHYYALNMQQFYGGFNPFDSEGKSVNYEQNKWTREQAMMRLAGVDKLEDMPLEFRLNINNPDYFMTVSSRSVAMSTLLNDAINQNLAGDKITDIERHYLKKALADLTDGKYLDYGENISRQVIQLDELKSIENAFDKILSIAKNHGFNLSEADENNFKNYIIQLANNNEMLYKHLVQGEFNWTGDKSWVADINKAQARYVLTGADGNCEIKDDDNSKFNEYSLYVVCLAALLKDALDASNTDENTYKSVSEAIKQFVKTYNKSVVEANSSKFPYAESARSAMRKNGFAAREIDVCADMLLKQAQYLAQKDGKQDLFSNSEELSALVYASAVEPAVQKLGISLSVLSALPGIATYFAGDELGATGGEDKTKNIYNQQRNARKVSELLEGAKQNIRTRIKDYIDYSMEIKSSLGVDALNSGTPYVIKTSSNDVPAILYQDAKGNMAISMINLTGYDHANRINYFERLKLQNAEERAKAFEQKSEDSIVSVNPDNPLVPIQKAYKLSYIELPPEITLPVGTTFYNAVKGCEADKFIVDYIEDNGRKFLGIVRDIAQGFGREIVINGKTGRNGVMVLKHAAKVAFKGNSINKQYNVTCPIYKNYSADNSMTVGQNLSILAN